MTQETHEVHHVQETAPERPPQTSAAEPKRRRPEDAMITINLKTVELAVLTLVAAANVYFGFTLSSLKKPGVALAAAQPAQASAPAPAQQQKSGLPSQVGGC